MLDEAAALLYVGGAGSCMGCGEATAIRMMFAATGFEYQPREHRHRRFDRMHHSLWLDLSIQPVSRALDQFAF